MSDFIFKTEACSLPLEGVVFCDKDDVNSKFFTAKEIIEQYSNYLTEEEKNKIIKQLNL